MKLTRGVAIALAALASGALPAVALGQGKSSTAPGHNKPAASSTAMTTTTTSTSSTSTTASATKAFGRVCRGESEKHVAGQSGTPFSRCVTALAHARDSAKTTS